MTPLLQRQQNEVNMATGTRGGVSIKLASTGDESEETADQQICSLPSPHPSFHRDLMKDRKLLGDLISASYRCFYGEQLSRQMGHLQTCSCLTQLAKYTCPRCNIRYCSLDCYKSEKHMQCSENFYREWFMNELQQRKGSPEERQRMLEMLKKLEAEEEDEEDMKEDGGAGLKSLEDRLAGLDLDRETDAVWQKLTPAERREFQKMVQSGALGHLLPVYVPWWEVSTPAVVPLETLQTGRSEQRAPEVLSNLPSLRTLIKGQPSPCVRYNVLNVLYAYAYMVRLFNGGQHELSLQACQAVLELSACLAVNTSFSMAGEALKHAMAAARQKPDLFNSAEFSVPVLRDVSHMLYGPKSHDCHVTQALSDIHQLLSTARAEVKTTKDRSKEPDGECCSKQLWLAKKKVYFFIVWANENSEDLRLLAKIVDVEYETSLMELEEHMEAVRKLKQRLPPQKPGSNTPNSEHKLIEELN